MDAFFLMVDFTGMNLFVAMDTDDKLLRRFWKKPGLNFICLQHSQPPDIHT